MRGRRPKLLICEDFHVTNSVEVDEQVLAADRFLVAKFLPIRRWDLVVFRPPHDPANVYVMRLVGMPGEEIEIINGSVWVNGRKLTPPTSLMGIEYAIEMEGEFRAVWGSPQRPAQLGLDEYFVLGDFSRRARDSRMWEQGAPGHNPFAVPASHLVGVVTHTYWPPARWETHY
jgi:signal peptidase I